MKFFDLGLVVFSPPNLIRKNTRQAINRLPFPSCHLRWMHFVLGRNLLRRPVSTQRLKRYSGLKLV